MLAPRVRAIAAITILSLAATLGGISGAAADAVPKTCHGGNPACPTPSATPSPTFAPTPPPTPTPAPTATPTATPAPTPTPAPTATPTPTPTPTPGTCPTSLQTAINNTAAGGTLNVGGCSFHEAVTVPRAMTVLGYGATLYGDSRGTWVTVNASGVTFAGWTMVGPVTNPAQSGAFRFASGTSGGHLYDCDLSGSTGGAAVAFGLANSTVIENCAIHDNKTLGLHGGGGSGQGRDNVLRNLDVYRNGDPTQTGFESGGVKSTVQTNLVIDGGRWHDNVGPGIWCDIHCVGGAIRNTKVYANSTSGIFYEISTGAVIENNAAWDNGAANAAVWWPWGSNILISSSGNVRVQGNTVARGSGGIFVASQCRCSSGTDRMADAATGIVIASNVIAQADGRYSLAWAQDWAGPLFTSGTNSGSADRYWYPVGENGKGRFAWTSQTGSLATFNGTPGEEGGTYLTTAEKDAALTAAGIPLQ